MPRVGRPGPRPAADEGDPPGWTLRAVAPAKLNLGLAVVGKRPDGYHDLLTIFQTIDLEDDLFFRETVGPGISLRVEAEEPIPGGADNLVLRAAELLAGARGVAQGAEILLRKRIPAGAGLGGGSSDAAAALLGLEALWGLAPDPEERRRLAIELGSDVPFFLVGGTARGEGRGEILTPLPGPPEMAWLLFVPDFRVSTADAFRSLPPTLTASRQELKMLEDAIIHGDSEAFARHVVNDLEPGVVRMEPRLARIRDVLRRRGARAVGLTGSGSAMFALFGSQGDLAPILDAGTGLSGGWARSCRPMDSRAAVVTRSHDDHRDPDCSPG